MEEPKHFCKYCGTRLSNSRKFCDRFCKADAEEAAQEFKHSDRKK
jgi:hypothetical protein